MPLRRSLALDPSLDNNRPFTLVTTTLSSVLNVVTTKPAASTISDQTPLSQHTLYYIIVPLVSLVVVSVVSLIIHMLVRRHRALYTHQLVPVFHYDPQDDSGWESELLDDADPPFVRDNQRPIVRGTLSINSANPDSNGTHAIKT